MPKQSRYTWDLDKLQFRHAATGQYVSPDQVFREVNRVVNVSERRMVKIADRLRAGEISISQFKLAMREEVKTLHIATAIAGNGGLAQMTPQRWGAVGGRLRSEFGYLNNFGAALGNGQLQQASGLVRSRSRAYSANARLAYWNTLNGRMTESGMVVEAMRKLGPVLTEHCPGCVSVAGEWMPLDNLPALGSMQCKWFCACSILYRIQRAAPHLDDYQATELEGELTATPEGLLASELTKRERAVLNRVVNDGASRAELSAAERRAAQRLLDQGTLALEEVDQRFVYRFTPRAPAAPPDLPTPAGSKAVRVATPSAPLTQSELAVYRKVVSSDTPLGITQLSHHEAHIAQRLVKRGHLRLVKRK